MDGYPIQTNFTSGEVSPFLLSRVDVNKFFNGAQKIENFIVKPQGGVVRRPGTKYVKEVKDSTKLTILLDFRFSNLDSFVLEIGNTYIRFSKNGSPVLLAGVPVEVVTQYLEADLRGLYFAQSADLLFIAHPNYPTKVLSRITDTNWTLSNFTFKDGPYLDLDNRDVSMKLVNPTNRVTLTNTVAEFVVGDVGKYIEYPYRAKTVIGKIITYVSTTNVTIEPYDNIVDVDTLDPRATLEFAAVNGNFSDRIRSTIDVWTNDAENSYIKVGALWYLTTTHLNRKENVAGAGPTIVADLMGCGTALTLKATTGVLQFVQASHTISADVVASLATFSANDIGRQMRFDFRGQQVSGTIQTYTNTTQVSIKLLRMVPTSGKTGETYINNGKTLNWRLGAFYTGNYPSVVVFHEERLWFAGTQVQPQTLWSSKSADFNNFAPTDDQSKVADDNAITITLASGQIDAIQWMISGRVLLIGTLGGEWQTHASSISNPLTPTNITVSEETSYGSARYVRPWKIGNSVFFVQRNGNQLRELIYDYQFDSYVAHDLTILSEHIARERNGIIQSAYQRSPNSIFWGVTSTGALIGLTFEKDQEVSAWHRHMIGGYISNGFVTTGDAEFNEVAVVESIAVVPSSNGFSETVYLCVKRNIIGLGVKRYIEYIDVEFDPVKIKNDLKIASGDPVYDPPLVLIKSEAYFVDCGITYRGAATNAVTGLTHLIGELVDVVADGSVRPRVTVSGAGVATFTGPAATIVHVGCFNRAWLKTMPIESGSDAGTAQGKLKRVHRVIVRLLNTIGFSYGSAATGLKMKSFREAFSRMSESPDLFTGDKSIDMTQDYGYDGVFILQQEQPYPINILCLMPQLQTYT